MKLKHTKKWCKITAGTLALTGAIATPIASTSCSNNENNATTYIVKAVLYDGTNYQPKLIEGNKQAKGYVFDISESDLSDDSVTKYISLNVVDNKTGTYIVNDSNHMIFSSTIEAKMGDATIVTNGNDTTQFDNIQYFGRITLPTVSVANSSGTRDINVSYTLTSTDPVFDGKISITEQFIIEINQ